MTVDTVTLRLPVFKPGQSVKYKGQGMKVNYVLLRNGELRVFLQGRESSVGPDELAVQATAFTYARRVPA